MKIIIFSSIIFLSFFANAGVLDSCKLKKSVSIPVNNLFDLWPTNSDMSKKLVISTKDENGMKDWLELSVFNKLRNSGETWGSPGNPSEFIYGMWGTNKNAKPMAVFMDYPGEQGSSSRTPVEYIKDIQVINGSTYYRLGNRSKYICNGENCIYGDHLDYIELLINGYEIVGIEVTTSKVVDAGAKAVWKQFAYCIKDAVLDSVVEWKYNN